MTDGPRERASTVATPWASRWKPMVIEPLDLLIVTERMRERLDAGMELPAGMDAQEAAFWGRVYLSASGRLRGA